MPPKLVASDLDGTLVRSDNTIGDRTRRAIAAGAAVVFCTARPHRGLDELAAETGHRGVVICNNGAMLWDLHTETVLEASPLEPAVAQELVALLEAEVPGGAWAVERTGGSGHEPEYVTRWPIPEGSTVGAVHALIEEPAVKLMLRHRDLSADALLERARAACGHLAAKAPPSGAADHSHSATRAPTTPCSRSAPRA